MSSGCDKSLNTWFRRPGLLAPMIITTNDAGSRIIKNDLHTLESAPALFYRRIFRCGGDIFFYVNWFLTKKKKL